MKYKERKSERGVYKGHFYYINEQFSIIKYDDNNVGKSIKVRVNKKNPFQPYNNDIIKFSVKKSNHYRIRNKVRIDEIVKRNTNRFVAKAENIKGSICILKGVDRKTPIKISVLKKFSKSVKINQLVAVEVYEWGTKQKYSKGKIVKILGEIGSHKAEMNAIMYNFSLPESFPIAVEKEAEKFKDVISNVEVIKRRDMRKVSTFTIDPDDAKDFDDAISYKMISENIAEVGVHIADVTHFVNENTLLDRVAKERATSVYLVDRTIPMLPERLSNDLCSLVPHKDRYACSIVWNIDTLTNEIKKVWIGKTIIHSDHRFTYESAQKVLDEKKGKCYLELKTLNNIAKKLKQKRLSNGAINFHTQELKFKLNEKGIPLEIKEKPTLETNHLIEELMLFANKCVAEYVVNQNKNYKFIYRTHGLPDSEKLNVLKNYASQFGYSLNFKNNLKNELNDFIAKIQGSPEQNTLEIMTLRCMDKAIYTTHKNSHFGLGFKHYSHFTSPIRRYPDLVAHRLLFQCLNNKNKNSGSLEKICQHCSKMEKNAIDAERASIKYKQVEYMSLQQKDVFKGFISGIIYKGMFVEIPEYFCEGFVHVKNMRNDRYTFDKKYIQMVGKKKNNVYKLAQQVTVKVKEINLEHFIIDFYLLP